jgi:excisionase family DNA binding protein
LLSESAIADDRLLLPVEDVARLLSVKPRTVWKWAACGRVPRPVKIGGRTLWRRAELEEWVEGGCPSRRWVKM